MEISLNTSLLQKQNFKLTKSTEDKNFELQDVRAAFDYCCILTFDSIIIV